VAIPQQTPILIPQLNQVTKVRGSISGCNSPPVLSDLIPVSTCETDTDLDTVNDTIFDNDKDGITNCTESYGNQVIETPILLVER
jgi:hypothetical protein